MNCSWEGFQELLDHCQEGLELGHESLHSPHPDRDLQAIYQGTSGHDSS